MKNGTKRVLTAGMLVSLLLANNVKAEELGTLKIGRSSNSLSNALVTCGNEVSLDEFWNNFTDYDFYKNDSVEERPMQTLKPSVTPEPVVSDNELVDGFNKADRSVLSYFSDAREAIRNYTNSSDYTNLKSKAKSLVITGIDFLFYDGTIKGYTRKQLTEKGKEYVMKYIADTLTELDYYFPGISDTILDKYGAAKEYIKSKFKDILGYVKDWMGEDYYNMFGEEFGELFDDFGDIGGVIGSLFDDKYQQWKLK